MDISSLKLSYLLLSLSHLSSNINPPSILGRKMAGLELELEDGLEIRRLQLQA
jgi:hypothetical protein